MASVGIQTSASSDTIPRGRTLLAWLPFLWSRAAFPGSDPAAEPIRWRSILLLLILPSSLLYVSMAFPLFEPDEGRYAEIPREMLVRGEWIVPYLQGEPYLDKPPLMYWLVILSYRIFGIHDWAARLIPALALHATILSVYLFGRRQVGERAAFRGALILSVTPAFMSIGRLLVLDGLLSLCVTVALFAGLEALTTLRNKQGWWIISALAVGLGILAKGPVAMILVLVPLGLLQWLRGQPLRVWSRQTMVYLGVVLAVALPWYIGICCRLPAFAGYFLWQHNLMRFLSPFDHLEPFWYYIPIIMFGFFAGSVILLWQLSFLLATESAPSSKRGPALGFFVLAGLWCVFFFSLSGSKLPTYVLPAFPFLALAAGYTWERSSWSEAAAPKRLVVISFALVCAGHNLFMPWYANYRGTSSRDPAILAYCRDANLPVLCYPRSCDTLSFYAGRDDLKCYRSKKTNDMIVAMMEKPRTMLLLTHRHSLESLKFALPPELAIVETKRMNLGQLPLMPKHWSDQLTTLLGETALGLCDYAIIERRVAARTGAGAPNRGGAVPPGKIPSTSVASDERP